MTRDRLVAFWSQHRSVRLGTLALAVALAAVPFAVSITRADWLDGRDMQMYLDATSRWLAGGYFYEPYQLAGPYAIGHGDVLYPPFAVLLFAPFAMLPAFLWWAVPIAVTSWVVWGLRPSMAGWVAILLCIAWPTMAVKVSTGNPVMWVIAAVALGVRFGWPGVLVLVKPTLAPFALVGFRRGSWWFALAALAVVSLPFGSMWGDWLVALLNSRDGGVLYSLFEVPMLALPLVARATATRLPVSPSEDQQSADRPPTELAPQPAG